jgi:hypothetical protein
MLTVKNSSDWKSISRNIHIGISNPRTAAHLMIYDLHLEFQIHFGSSLIQSVGIVSVGL